MMGANGIILKTDYETKKSKMMRTYDDNMKPTLGDTFNEK